MADTKFDLYTPDDVEISETIQYFDDKIDEQINTLLIMERAQLEVREELYHILEHLEGLGHKFGKLTDDMAKSVDENIAEFEAIRAEAEEELYQYIKEKDDYIKVNNLEDQIADIEAYNRDMRYKPSSKSLKNSRSNVPNIAVDDIDTYDLE